MKRNTIIAVVIGAAIVAGYFFYQKKKKKKTTSGIVGISPSADSIKKQAGNTSSMPSRNIDKNELLTTLGQRS